MRFDDRIATVLALPGDSPAARIAQWRQLVDLVAQRSASSPDKLDASAYAFLETHRQTIPMPTRKEVARSLAGRVVAPGLITFFATDHPSVASPILTGVTLDERDWLDLLPILGPTARALLRHRRDLPSAVVRALASFGPSDFALPGAAIVEVAQPAAGADRPLPVLPDREKLPELLPPKSGDTQIRELVEKIEAYRRKKAERPKNKEEDPAMVAESFRWETGADGVILWVEGAPRGPLVGQSIASMAEPGQYGVDGQAAGAYEKRAPFRDARLEVPGAGPASGDWRISGVPFFDPAGGYFLGYRGSARRPRIDEVARPGHRFEHEGVFGTELRPDSLRQLVHELRTPLNAIIGFAEMIDGQYMGPADARYRSRAGHIMEQASRLLAAVDDLDAAARLDKEPPPRGQVGVDTIALLCRLHDSFGPVTHQRGVQLRIEVATDLPPAAVEPGAAERMFSRLIAAVIGLAAADEALVARLDAANGAVPLIRLSLDRPAAICGVSEAALFDPGYSPEGDWPDAPALGLGFALRLVRNLAEASGGALRIGGEQLVLELPQSVQNERSSGSHG